MFCLDTCGLSLVMSPNVKREGIPGFLPSWFDPSRGLQEGSQAKPLVREILLTAIRLVATLVLTIGGFGLLITPAGAAEMMQSGKAMMKATEEDLMALKNELAAIQAELQKLTARVGSMSKIMEKAVSDHCKSVPESLRAAGWVPGLCR